MLETCQHHFVAASSAVHDMSDSVKCTDQLRAVEKIDRPKFDAESRQTPGVSTAVDQRNDFFAATVQALDQRGTDEPGCTDDGDFSQCTPRFLNSAYGSIVALDRFV